MFENLNQELSDYLKLIRFKRKMSQDEVAEKLCVSRNTYGTWENNPVSLSLDTLIKICNVFNEDIIYFFKQYVAKSNNKEEREV